MTNNMGNVTGSITGTMICNMTGMTGMQDMTGNMRNMQMIGIITGNITGGHITTMQNMTGNMGNMPMTGHITGNITVHMKNMTEMKSMKKCRK